MQDSDGCDNNRTSVIFKVPDIYRFVGGIAGFKTGGKPVVQISKVTNQPCALTVRCIRCLVVVFLFLMQFIVA